MSEFVAEKLVFETGERESSGGRRAMAFSVNTDEKKSLGINITRNHVDYVLVNLAQKTLDNITIEKKFNINRQYFSDLYAVAERFVSRNGIKMSDLLGTGIAFPGIVNGNVVLRSHALEIDKPILLDNVFFAEEKVIFFNDATAACMAELCEGDSPENFDFISLSDTVGGASVIRGKIVPGDLNRNGEIGHVCVIPGGKQCYCGKRGHYDSYGSAKLLKDRSDNGTVERFLERVKNGEKEQQEFFNEYLDYLALIVSNLHMITDAPVIIGGYVGINLEEYLDDLREKTKLLDIFPRDEEYVLLAKHGMHAAAEGAASYFIEQFIDSL